jgi:hypothetical protein
VYLDAEGAGEEEDEEEDEEAAEEDEEKGAGTDGACSCFTGRKK